MASNVNVGLGIGLQAQLQAPAQVFARQQQQKIAAQQAALKRAAEDEDLLSRLQKDVSVNSKELHRLVKKPVADISANAINELIKAKSSGDLNWRNKAVDITNNYKNELAHLSGLSDQYKNFEKNYETLGNYKTREQQSLRELMNGSQTYTEMLDKAKKANMAGVDVESGLILSNQFMPRVDLNRTLDSTFSKVSPIETSVKTVKEGGNEYQEVRSRVPLMKSEADLIAGQRGLTFVPSIESTAEEIIADPTLRTQYADTYGINPQDEAALKSSIMNEGRKFVEEGIKRRNLGNQNIKVVVNMGEEEPFFGFNKSVQSLDTGGFKSASAGSLTMDVPGYSITSVNNLTDQTGSLIPGGTLDKQVVKSLRVMPWVQDPKSKAIRPAKVGEKPAGYQPFVMFGTAGSQKFLPAEEFTFVSLMKDGKDVTNVIRKSIQEANAYADQLDGVYLAERKKEGAIKNAFASGDVFKLTNELKNKIK